MTASNEQEIRRLANAIRSYVSAHPDAADTVEGILRWWIVHPYLISARRNLDAAVELGTTEGWLERRVGADRAVVYAATRPDWRESDVLNLES